MYHQHGVMDAMLLMRERESGISRTTLDTGTPHATRYFVIRWVDSEGGPASRPSKGTKQNIKQYLQEIVIMASDTTCKAIVFTAIERVEYLDIPKPTIETPTDAVLRVLACGICGSDLHPFHGREGIYN